MGGGEGGVNYGRLNAMSKATEITCGAQGGGPDQE